MAKKWQVGNNLGYNANIIYEGSDAVCEVFGVPLHTRVSEAGEGKLAIARQIVTEHNMHEELVELADECAHHLYERQDVTRVKELAKDILKKLGRL